MLLRQKSMRTRTWVFAIAALLIISAGSVLSSTAPVFWAPPTPAEPDDTIYTSPFTFDALTNGGTEDPDVGPRFESPRPGSFSAAGPRFPWCGPWHKKPKHNASFTASSSRVAREYPARPRGFLWAPRPKTIGRTAPRRIPRLTVGG